MEGESIFREYACKKNSLGCLKLSFFIIPFDNNLEKNISIYKYIYINILMLKI